MNDTPEDVKEALDDPSLVNPQAQKAELEIGIINDKIGYRIINPNNEPIMLLFTVAEMYNIMSAQQLAINYIQNQTLPNV